MVLPGVTNVILIQLVTALLNLTAKNADILGPLLQMQQYHGDMLMQSVVAKIAILLQLQTKADQVEILVEVLTPEEDLPLVMVLVLAVVLTMEVAPMAEAPMVEVRTAEVRTAVAPMAAAPTVEVLMVVAPMVEAPMAVVPTAAEALLLLTVMMTLTVTVLLTVMMI